MKNLWDPLVAEMDFTGSEEDGEDDLEELFADGHLMCNKEYERKLFKNAILLQT